MKGLLVEVFRSLQNGKPVDCTNGGASSKHDMFILTNNGRDADRERKRSLSLDGPFSPNEESPELVLVVAKWGYYAVPRDLYDRNRWVMFGGNFIYSSDSRFPSDAPIKVFDRVEDAELTRALSV